MGPPRGRHEIYGALAGGDFPVRLLTRWFGGSYNPERPFDLAVRNVVPWSSLMQRVLHLIAAVALVFGSLSAAARAADEESVPNPPYKHWSAFKAGTTVTQKEKIHFLDKDSDEADYYSGGVSEKDVTYKVLEVTPQKVVLQSTIAEHGRGSIVEHAPTKITYPATIAKSQATTSKEDIETFKEGVEDVKVLGKTIHCKKVHLIDQDGDETFEHQIWTSDEMPGGFVKDVKITKKANKVVSESELVIVSFEVK